MTFILRSSSLSNAVTSSSSKVISLDVADLEAHSVAPPNKPVVANILIEKPILQFLNINSKLRKARLLISAKDENAWNERLLRDLIDKRIPLLHQKPYRIEYKLTSGENYRSFKSDEDLSTVFKFAHEAGVSLQLLLKPTPGIFPPPNESDEYLPVDPDDSDKYTLVSFYKFCEIPDTKSVKEEFFRLWSPLKALGRVYVAKEGVNAQMSVATNVLDRFIARTRSHPIFNNITINTDHALSREEFLEVRPFSGLHIREREQILADGFDAPLDWKKSGTELAPMEWHKALDDPNAIILDCRNTYETQVGIFDKAIPLNTTVFRESWSVLEEVLKDRPKDSPILTYCTGGIRCVKINAYLEQELGFTNTNRLKGGIIAYRRDLDNEKKQSSAEQGSMEVKESLSSKFKGVNYVFDERMGARITDDVLTQCESCGEPDDSYTNCKSFDCNVSFLHAFFFSVEV